MTNKNLVKNNKSNYFGCIVIYIFSFSFNIKYYLVQNICGAFIYLIA